MEGVIGLAIGLVVGLLVGFFGAMQFVTNNWNEIKKKVEEKREDM